VVQNLPARRRKTKREHHKDPNLKLNGIPIKTVKEFKVLGVIFKVLKPKCGKALDILKDVCNAQWSADKNFV
jgi:hypothetical protein